jgi:(p)ppGpp synthase/HD superfamily hydrolase
MNNFIDLAIEYACKKHDLPSESQRYGSESYSVHLFDVLKNGEKYSYYLPTDKLDIVLSAIMLHDTVEDTDTSPKKLKEKFNEEIADIVFRVSNERGWDRKERNFKTYPKIWVSDFAIFVKLCDRIANTKNSKESGHHMYKVYVEEYPIFRYALKVRGLYSDMWDELDELNNFRTIKL